MTAVPGAIDGLLSIARAAPAIAGSNVRVDDGPWISHPSEPAVMVVGWLPVQGPTVAWVEDAAGLGRRAEVFDIHCLASAFEPDTVLKSARDRADGMLEALRAEVNANQTLNGAVSRARVAATHMTSFQNSDGCGVTIEFLVQVHVF